MAHNGTVSHLVAPELELVPLERNARKNGGGGTSVGHRFGRWFVRVADRLSSSQQDSLTYPMVVTRRIKASAPEATAVLSRAHTIEWGDGRSARRLAFEPLHRDQRALGGPRVAEAAILGRWARTLPVSIAIFDGRRDRCIVQIRPGYRRPWGIRRRRRCQAAAHDAADRVIELILAVDYRPPDGWYVDGRPDA